MASKPSANSSVAQLSGYRGENLDVVPACAVATLMPSNIKAKPAADIVGAPVWESLPLLTATSHPGINSLIVVDLLCTIQLSLNVGNKDALKKCAFCVFPVPKKTFQSCVYDMVHCVGVSLLPVQALALSHFKSGHTGSETVNSPVFSSGGKKNC